MPDTNPPKKIVLAYSCGLDTSVILPWLKQRYRGVKQLAFAAERGQADELKAIEDEARNSGTHRDTTCRSPSARKRSTARTATSGTSATRARRSSTRRKSPTGTSA